MDAAGLSLLLSEQGWALLTALPPYDEARVMALSTRLQAEGLDPALVAAALTQSKLRARARAKFGDFADGMLFTSAGLEQATRLPVAAHHARRYLAAGLTTVADLTAGIGADAMALAGHLPDAGASSGIGAALARLLSASGRPVLAVEHAIRLDRAFVTAPRDLVGAARNGLDELDVHQGPATRASHVVVLREWYDP